MLWKSKQVILVFCSVQLVQRTINDGDRGGEKLWIPAAHPLSPRHQSSQAVWQSPRCTTWNWFDNACDPDNAWSPFRFGMEDVLEVWTISCYWYDNIFNVCTKIVYILINTKHCHVLINNCVLTKIMKIGLYKNLSGWW